MKTQTIAVLVAVATVAGIMWYVQKPAFPIMSENQTVPSLAPVPSANSGASKTSVTPSKPATSAAGAKTYANPAYGFRFEYPASMTIESAVSAGGFKTQGAVGVVGAFARLDTVVERFSVSVSKEPADMGECTEPAGASSVTTLNGVPFVTYQLKETKEGQNITTTVYRVMRNSMCYELRDTQVSSVTAELTAYQNAQQTANIEAAKALVDSIVQSFRFTN